MHSEVSVYEETKLFSSNPDLWPSITKSGKVWKDSFDDISIEGKDKKPSGQLQTLLEGREVANEGQSQNLPEKFPQSLPPNLKETKNDCNNKIFPCADGLCNETVNSFCKDKGTKESEKRENEIRNKHGNTGLKSQSLSTELAESLQKAETSESKAGKSAADTTPLISKTSYGSVTDKLSSEPNTSPTIQTPHSVEDEKRLMVSTRSKSSSNSEPRVHGSPTYTPGIPQVLEKQKHGTPASPSSSQTSSKKKSPFSFPWLSPKSKPKNPPSSVAVTNRKDNGMGNPSGGMSNSVDKMGNPSRKMSTTLDEMSSPSDGMSYLSGRMSKPSRAGSPSWSLSSGMNEGAVQNKGTSGNYFSCDTDESFFRDLAVHQLGLIRWTFPLKPVHLMKNDHGRSGFKCKVKEVS